MANDFKKDDFQKDEPVKPCISCEAVDEFVLVRRPMQEMHLHRDQYRRNGANMSSEVSRDTVHSMVNSWTTFSGDCRNLSTSSRKRSMNGILRNSRSIQ